MKYNEENRGLLATKVVEDLETLLQYATDIWIK
jgi:hypothetical protein